MTENHQHWETVYRTKQPDQVSWTQAIPQTSLEFIRRCQVPKTAPIIDIGGGDSTLVDCLLAEGYEQITVLDISAHALARAQQRIGKQANRVNWIVSDVLTFRPTATYTIWHDRATFHFLTSTDQIATYLQTARQAVTGFMTMGTFSENGPDRCSGLAVKQYSEPELEEQLKAGFTKLHCVTEDHQTPLGTTQNFLFCRFKRNLSSSL